MGDITSSSDSMSRLVLVCACLAACSAIELTFWADPQGTECFFEDIYKGDAVSGNFQVTTGGNMEVDFQVLTPTGKSVIKLDSVVEHMFEFGAEESGEYTFCFSNTNTYHDMKSITFELNADHPLANTNAIADKNSMSDLQDKLRQLQLTVRDVQSTQRYLRNREIRHRNTTDSTNSRVLWWSVLEAVVIVALSAFQVYYIRSFFDRKGSGII
eukprot:c8885_g1_i1.p1 GENE.c8885_g1_i1~~c8885_g1_i1.p1  ORF type:complete len:213 (-),score=55.65 c8885_g1_i1:102-740(-)